MSSWPWCAPSVSSSLPQGISNSLVVFHTESPSPCHFHRSPRRLCVLVNVFLRAQKRLKTHINVGTERHKKQVLEIVQNSRFYQACFCMAFHCGLQGSDDLAPRTVQNFAEAIVISGFKNGGNHFSILGSDIVQKSVLVSGFAAVPFRFHVAENQGTADGSRNQDETRILV